MVLMPAATRSYVGCRCVAAQGIVLLCKGQPAAARRGSRWGTGGGPGGRVSTATRLAAQHDILAVHRRARSLWRCRASCSAWQEVMDIEWQPPPHAWSSGHTQHVSCVCTKGMLTFDLVCWHAKGPGRVGAEQHAGCEGFLWVQAVSSAGSLAHQVHLHEPLIAQPAQALLPR